MLFQQFLYIVLFTVSKKLTKDIHIEQIKVFEELIQANKLLEIY